MRPAEAFLLAGAVCAFGTHGAAQTPLSAIDWLDDPPQPVIAAPRVVPADEPPTATGVTVPEVEVLPLDAAGRDPVGLLPMAVTGLPATLWQASDAATLRRLWSGLGSDPLPAVQALYYTLLLAEAEPPRRSDGDFLRTRVDVLMGFGAVDPALALLERAGPETRALFPAYFDLALLSGAEVEACRRLRETPTLHPDYAARIYCTALGGDWATAFLLYDSAVMLDRLGPTEAQLLGQFLDPEAAEAALALAPASDPSPLLFRLYEAVGQDLPTRSLPIAFAAADLRSTSGWKAEIEAAERLVRSGALPENLLLGLYTDRKPAASGGVWDRVAAVQAFEAALGSGDTEAVARTLPAAWRHMAAEHLEVPFARLFAEDLAKFDDLPPRAASLALRVMLLSEDYEAAAARATDADAFLAAVARGTPAADTARTGLERAIAEGFGGDRPTPAPEHARRLAEGKLGETILRAARQADQAGGDLVDVTAAIRTLRAVGLEDSARRIALQMLILDRRT